MLTFLFQIESSCTVGEGTGVERCSRAVQISSLSGTLAGTAWS